MNVRTYVPQVTVRGPKRRQQLVEATVRILVRDGVTGVTHRAVSEEAGLPMSATTYYFTSLDDLILATFQALYTSFVSDSFHVALRASTDPVGEIADNFHDLLTGRRDAYLLIYELHLTAARRPELRGYASILWDQQLSAFRDILGVSRATASAMSAVLDGYAFAALSVGEIPDRVHLRRLLESIVQGDDPGGNST